MKRKVFLAILLLLLLSQFPFAYRRYRLYRLQSAIQQLAAQRHPITSDEYVDYKGVIHVHSFIGGHSTGAFTELIAGAKANGLNFVIMTEHPQASFDTSAMTLNGVHEGVLFINGNEVATASGDRLLLIPGAANAAGASTRDTQEIIEEQRRNGGLSFVAYPSESGAWQPAKADGVEIYNLFTNAREIKPAVMFFDGLWSYRSYADLLFANFFLRPEQNLQRWDATMRETSRGLVAIAGNDAHSNVGLSLNDANGNQLVGLKLDPYERSFRVVRTHVLLKKDEPITRENLLRALAEGRCYVSFDLFADPTGFSFTADDPGNAQVPRAVVGGGIPSSGRILLTVKAPLACRFVLFRDGERAEEKEGSSVQFIAESPGRYRVEAYLDALPAPVRGQPWIISNPIWVTPTLPKSASRSPEKSSKTSS
jgi:hypothetical protein